MKSTGPAWELNPAPPIDRSGLVHAVTQSPEPQRQLTQRWSQNLYIYWYKLKCASTVSCAAEAGGEIYSIFDFSVSY